MICRRCQTNEAPADSLCRDCIESIALWQGSGTMVVIVVPNGRDKAQALLEVQALVEGDTGCVVCLPPTADAGGAGPQPLEGVFVVPDVEAEAAQP